MEYPSELVKFLKNKFRFVTWRVYKIDESYFISADDKEFLKSELFLSVWSKIILQRFLLVDNIIPIIHNSEIILRGHRPIVEHKKKKK